MFDFTLAKHQLLTPLLSLAGALDKKQITPILSNILLEVTDNQLQLTATDLEIEVTARLVCNNNSSWQTTVPAKKFIDIIRCLEDNATPTIRYDEGTLFINSGRSQFKLATMPAENFPKQKKPPNELEFMIPRVSFINLLQRTSFAISQQDVRVYLNGLLLEISSDFITAVTTDGHRMAVCRFPCSLFPGHHRFLLPRKGVQEILRLLNHISDEHVSVFFGKGFLRLDAKEYTFESKLIEARFPNYANAIPSNQDKWLLVDRDLLKRALIRISILANEKSRAILLHLQENALLLIGSNQEHEEATESVEAQTSGESFKIGINGLYLLEVLNFIAEGTIKLSMSTIDSSILVESVHDEYFQYIIMPMKF